MVNYDILWLVVSTNPSEKWWWKSVGMDGNSQLNGTKTSNMFQTTNQKLWFKQWTLDLMTQIWDLTIFQGCIQQEKGDLSILKQPNIGI